MKAERINKNQIRFTLTKADLQARHLKMSDLSYGSDKTKALFDDMMHQAVSEFGFSSGSEHPLMIEAIPLSEESLMITVTQVADKEDLLSMFRSNIPDASDPAAAFPVSGKDQGEKADENEVREILYSFDSFNTLLEAAGRINPELRLRNTLYHDEATGTYHLYLTFSRSNAQIRYCMTLLTEYASEITKDPLTLLRIQEHCKIAVHTRAIQKLARLEQS